MKPFLFVCIFVVSVDAQNLGHIDFPTSGSPAAQKHFIQGVLLLHSFEYADAREEFQAASKIEPGFAMAYWGEALTYTHPLWVQQDAKAAREVLTRAPAAPTEREKDYLSAVRALYGEGDKVARDTAYAEAMRHMHEKYADDLEAATLYAVALMGTCQFERNYAVYMRAAAVAEEVFAKNPQHPGAIHYLIHAYDDPIHAPLGLRAARVYAKVAGAASHAQHMPAHIFVALGMWDDVVSSNIMSSKVADDRMKAKGLGLDARNYHALYWLEYGYLEQGRVADAERVLADVAQSAGQTKSGGNLAAMRATYAIETGTWDKLGDLKMTNGGMVQNIAALTSLGMCELRRGNKESARKMLIEARGKLTGGGEGPSHYAAGMAMPDSPNDRKQADIMLKELDALLLRAEGKKDAAMKTLTEAAAAEDALSFEFGPPVPPKPVHELVGEVLLEDGRKGDARKEFEKALQRAPGRRLSLRGLQASQN